MAKILVVDDEQVLVKGIKFNLEHEGYQVEVGYDGEQAVELAREGSFDLILLDLMMPKIDGLQACMRIREFSNVPIIMLTAKGEDTDKIMGFECGADDYITNPFEPAILLARIAAVLKRTAKSSEPRDVFCLSHKNVTLDTAVCRLFFKEQAADLTKTELKILHLLFRRKGEIIPRLEIIEYLWDNQIFIDDNTLSVNITRIRGKLEEIGVRNLIETKRGMGYRICESWNI